MPHTALAVSREDLAKVLLESARNTFSTLFSQALGLRETGLRPELPEWSGISAIVGLGGSVRGTVVVLCPAALARRLTLQLLGEADAEEPLVQDAMGELANIVAGGVKTQLDSAGNEILLSVPTVVAGASHRVGGPGNSEWTIHRLSLDEETFLIAARFVGP